MTTINKNWIYFMDYTKSPAVATKLYGRASICYFLPEFNSQAIDKIIAGTFIFDPNIIKTLKSHLEAQNRIILNDGDDPDAVPLTCESWMEQFFCALEDRYPDGTAYVIAEELFKQLQTIL